MTNEKQRLALSVRVNVAHADRTNTARYPRLRAAAMIAPWNDSSLGQEFIFNASRELQGSTELRNYSETDTDGTRLGCNSGFHRSFTSSASQALFTCRLWGLGPSAKKCEMNEF